MNVLLIDDDDDDVLFFSEALREIFPASVLRRYSNADDAIYEISRNKMDKADLIFIDINMPAVNGWECLREIKKMAGWQHTPIVMYSSADLGQSGISPADVGAVAFYQKSDSYQKLKQQLKQIIDSIL